MIGHTETERKIRIPNLNRQELDQLRHLYRSTGGARSRQLTWGEEVERLQMIAAMRGRSAREIILATAEVRIGDWDALNEAAASLFERRSCR